MELTCSFCGLISDDHDNFIPGYWAGDTYVESPVCHECVTCSGITFDSDGEYSMEVV